MARRVRLILVVLASILATTSNAGTQSLPTSSAARGQAMSIDKLLADAVLRGDIPGVVAMATDRRGIIYQGAFGLADAANGRSMTIDSIFRIASMTKPITSVGAMQLIEQGRLGLDDTQPKSIFPSWQI